MSARGRIVAAIAALAVGLVLPAAASAHAYLVKTVPAASGVLDVPPPNVQLTYDEAVEPRFAIISVTNAAGNQQTTGPVSRSPANPDTLVVPLRPHLPEGWYLIYWRAISVDGHPVQGAFTYAVGPNPGPAPRFAVPSIAGSATSLRLLIARWVMFLSVMSAIGLFVFRVLIARPAVRRAPGTSLRAVSRAFVIASVHRAAGDPGLSRYRDRDRFAALRVRSRRARPAVSRDGVRTRLRRHDGLLRAVLPRRLDRCVARSPRPRATVDRRGRVDRRRAAGCRSGAAVARQRRARGADLPARDLGDPRLAASDHRLAVARRSDRTDRPVGQPSARRCASAACRSWCRGSRTSRS